MIFKEIIKSKGESLKIVLDKLFELVIEKQVHSGDLLLVNENGFHKPEVREWDNIDQEFLPYSIGLNDDGHSEIDHFKFIDSYRRAYECRISHSEYLKEIKWDSNQKDRIDKMIFSEVLSINIEMLVYLKIWESDMFIKRFYQLGRLSNGLGYDWHFKISEYNRAKGSTGTRQQIIRTKIRDKFKKSIPELYNSFQVSYNTQIRNAIAHSKYSFLDRYIHLNNYDKSDQYSQLKVLKFDDWIDKFHETMVIYNEYVRFFSKVNSHYIEVAKRNNNLVEVRLEMKDPVAKTEYRYMEYRSEWKDFKIKRL